jgi:hypothetical protein
MRHIFLFVFLALLLSGCNNFWASEKYQVLASSDGNTYRLDKSSGEVWLIKGGSMEKVPPKDFRLKIGQRYIAEDIYSFTYLGKGQIGDVKSIGDY